MPLTAPMLGRIRQQQVCCRNCYSSRKRTPRQRVRRARHAENHAWRRETWT